VAVAGQDYCVVAASTRMSTGFSILKRDSSLFLQLCAPCQRVEAGRHLAHLRSACACACAGTGPCCSFGGAQLAGKGLPALSVMSMPFRGDRSDQLVIVTAGFQADSRTLHKTLQARCPRGSVPARVHRSVASATKGSKLHSSGQSRSSWQWPRPALPQPLLLAGLLLYRHGHRLGKDLHRIVNELQGGAAMPRGPPRWQASQRDSGARRRAQARYVQYQFAHRRPMSVAAMAQLLGNTLYYKRFFPYYTFNLCAGLDAEGEALPPAPSHAWDATQQSIPSTCARGWTRRVRRCLLPCPMLGTQLSAACTP
jgi:hypothetical protein